MEYISNKTKTPPSWRTSWIDRKQPINEWHQNKQVNNKLLESCPASLAQINWGTNRELNWCKVIYILYISHYVNIHMFHYRNINVFDNGVRPQIPLKLVYNTWVHHTIFQNAISSKFQNTSDLSYKDWELIVKSRAGNSDCNFKHIVREAKWSGSSGATRPPNICLPRTHGCKLIWE